MLHRFFRRWVGVLLAFPALVCAQTAGTLFTNSSESGKDWFYPPPFSIKSVETLRNGGQITLRARFVWEGAGPVDPTNNPHAIAAYTQGEQTSTWNSMYQPIDQPLWGFGAGAFVSPEGLALEVWKGFGQGITWSQARNRCASVIDGITNPQGLQPCLAAEPNEVGYITSAPGFTLMRGQAYWLKVTLTGQGPASDWITLKAELLIESNGGIPRPVQEGRVGFQASTYFMPQAPHLRATVARATQGTEHIHFRTFDSDF